MVGGGKQDNYDDEEGEGQSEVWWHLEPSVRMNQKRFETESASQVILLSPYIDFCLPYKGNVVDVEH